jgi:hypothetical protein
MRLRGFRVLLPILGAAYGVTLDWNRFYTFTRKILVPLHSKISAVQAILLGREQENHVLLHEITLLQ